MPEVFSVARVAQRLRETADRLEFDAHALRDEGWRISAQQLRNAVDLLYDVERRLKNGDDWRG